MRRSCRELFGHAGEGRTELRGLRNGLYEGFRWDPEPCSMDFNFKLNSQLSLPTRSRGPAHIRAVLLR